MSTKRPDLPDMFRVHQHFDPQRIEDLTTAVQTGFKHIDTTAIRPGQRVAITAGSRGITDIAAIIKRVVAHCRHMGLKPFIFPAMGSHGGATAEGQTALLAHLGITEASMAAPIRASMAVVEIGKTTAGIPAFMDEIALTADHIIVVNRIKAHTKFKADIESGLMKMMAIGVGKQKGAQFYHKAAIQHGFANIITAAARSVLEKTPIWCGVAIVENGHGQTAHLEVIPADRIEAREKALLEKAKTLSVKLPFNDIDLLIVDQMGKNISGIGMDPNVTGRNRDIMGVFPHPVQVKRLFVRDLTPQSNGNAHGIGLADVTTTRLVDQIDFRATYKNAITGISIEKAAIPMHLPCDRDAIETALGSVGLKPLDHAKIVRIKNTADLQEIEVSSAYLTELKQRRDLKILRGPDPIHFDPDGNLPTL